MKSDEIEKYLQVLEELKKKYEEVHGWLLADIVETSDRLRVIPCRECVTLETGEWTLRWWSGGGSELSAKLADSPDASYSAVSSLPIQVQRQLYDYIPKFLELVREKVESEI